MTDKDAFAERRHRIASVHVKEAAEEIDAVQAAVPPNGRAFKQASAIMLMINTLHQLIDEELT